jgi:hypothetical protein
MTGSYIPKWLRERIAEQAAYRCGYCLSSERIVGAPMELDHIIPESLGGLTQVDNLWLACSMCNDHKSNRMVARDPLTGDIVRLFDPRRQQWHEHFRWNNSGDRILGRTTVGRATVVALRLNRTSLVTARRLWVTAGWHPPRS